MAEQFIPKRRVYKTSAPDWIVAMTSFEALTLCAAYYGATIEDLGDDVDGFEPLGDTDTVTVTGMTGEEVDARLQGLKQAGADLSAFTVSRSASGSSFLCGGYLGPYKMSAPASEWAKLPSQFLCTVNF